MRWNNKSVIYRGCVFFVAAWCAPYAQTQFGNHVVISTSANAAFSVYASDLDADGDQDVLSASYSGNEIVWYENTDGIGTFGLSQIIAQSSEYALCVYTSDLDGDGDPDVLSASAYNNKISWYENLLENSGINGSSQRCLIPFHLGSLTTNPRTSTATIEFSFPAKTHVILSIYGLAGRLVATLVKGTYGQGTHRLSFNTADLPAGAYVYTFNGGEIMETLSMVLVR